MENIDKLEKKEKMLRKADSKLGQAVRVQNVEKVEKRKRRRGK